MSQAHDLLTLSNEQKKIMLDSIKRTLRFISLGDVLLTFDDGSKLLYVRTDSWRTDTLQIIE